MRRLWSWWTTGLGYGSPCDFLPQRTSGGSAPTTPRRRGLSPAIVGFIVLLSATVEAMVILGAIFPGSRNDHATRRAGQRDIMTVYVQTIINAVAGHHTVVYGLVGLLALSESLPIVGAVVPGTALIVGLSALVPSGALSVWPLVVAAILGAIVGDGLSFWCGHRYRQTLTGVWPFTRYPQLISRGEAFFQQHGGKSVFLARFTPGVRAVIPLVAGMVGMPVGRFYHVNILSALVWAPAHILPGLLVGATLALTGAVALRLAVLLVLTLALLWLTAWAARFSLRHGLPYLTRAQYCLWQWAQGRDTWLRRQLLALLDPTRTETKSLVLIAALLIGTLWLFTGILEDVVSGDPLVRIDATVFNFLQTLRTTWSDRIMIALTELGDGAVTLPLTVVVLLWLLVRRNWSTAAYWLGAVSFAALATLIMKITLHLPRPEAGLYSGWRAFSFPSGHTVVNTTLYGFLAFLIAHRVQPLWRNAIVVGLALVVIAIAFSRLYLGADWVSDVIGGVAFGLAWVTVMSMAYSRHDAPILPAGQLLCIVCATVVVAGAVHVSRSYLTDVTRYALHPASRTLSVAEWWRGAWRTMPTWRIDLKGEREEALTVQWAGSPNGLKQRLLATGWQVPEPWSISGVFAWLASPTLPAKLPVLPQLQEGRPATLTLIYLKTPQEVPGTRLVLRLWATGVNLRDDQVRNLPLLIGTVVEEHFSRPFSLVTLSREVPDLNMPREQLAAALGRVQVEQRVQRSTAPRWDGRVLLLHDSVPSLQPCGAPIP